MQWFLRVIEERGAPSSQYKKKKKKTCYKTIKQNAKATKLKEIKKVHQTVGCETVGQEDVQKMYWFFREQKDVLGN